MNKNRKKWTKSKSEKFNEKIWILKSKKATKVKKFQNLKKIELQNEKNENGIKVQNGKK